MNEIGIGWVDIGFAAFLMLSIGVGLMRGFVFELLSLAGWVVAYLAARWGAPSALAHFHAVGSTDSALNYGIAFACVFIAVLVVWGLAARLVRALVHATPLSLFDRVLGAGFGLLRGVALLLIAATVVGVSPWSSSPAWRESQSAVWLKGLLHDLRPWGDRYFINDTSRTTSA